MYLVVYDVCDSRRLKRISVILQRYGRRVQKSVFECDTRQTRYAEMCRHLKRIKHETDKIFIYHLRPDTRKEEIGTEEIIREKTGKKSKKNGKRIEKNFIED